MKLAVLEGYRSYQPGTRLGDDTPAATWTLTDLTNLNATMDLSVQRMRTAVAAIRAKIGVTSSILDSLAAGVTFGISELWTIPQEVKDGMKNALPTIDNIINRMDGPDRADVLSGALNPAKWQAAAEETIKNIKDLGAQLDDQQTIDLIATAESDVAASWANFFKNQIAKPFADSFGWLTWAIPLSLLAVGGLVVYNYLTLPATAARTVFRGYPRRTKRRQYRTKRAK